MVAHAPDRSHVFSLAELFLVALDVLLLNCFSCRMRSVEHTSSLPVVAIILSMFTPFNRSSFHFLAQRVNINLELLGSTNNP